MTRIIALIVAYIWTLVWLGAGSVRGYDCALASFHPDYPQAVREACRRQP
jgi:hypothetical protein